MVGSSKPAFGHIFKALHLNRVLEVLGVEDGQAVVDIALEAAREERREVGQGGAAVASHAPRMLPRGCPVSGGGRGWGHTTSLFYFPVGGPTGLVHGVRGWWRGLRMAPSLPGAGQSIPEAAQEAQSVGTGPLAGRRNWRWLCFALLCWKQGTGGLPLRGAILRASQPRPTPCKVQSVISKLQPGSVGWSMKAGSIPQLSVSPKP